MMNEAHIPIVELESVRSEHAIGVNRIYDYFANKSLDDVMQDMPEPTYVDIDDSRQVQLLELMPDGSDIDPTRTIALGLPFLNGLAPHQFMRAKAMQLLVGPEVPVVVMPNNSHKNEAYTFTDNQRLRLAEGNIKPLGEIQVAAFERLNATKRALGALQITGYSQGALTALAMGAVGSAELNVTTINADEAPSKLGRTAKQLKSDFLAGGMFDVPNEAKDTDIDALMTAISKPRFILDIVRFGIQSVRRDSKLIQQAMTGSADHLVTIAATSGADIKLGYVEGSPIFNTSSIMTEADNVRLVAYGKGFDRGHASGDNIIKHALMAADGLNR